MTAAELVPVLGMMVTADLAGGPGRRNLDLCADWNVPAAPVTPPRSSTRRTANADG